MKLREFLNVYKHKVHYIFLYRDKRHFDHRLDGKRELFHFSRLHEENDFCNCYSDIFGKVTNYIDIDKYEVVNFKEDKEFNEGILLVLIKNFKKY